VTAVRWLHGRSAPPGVVPAVPVPLGLGYAVQRLPSGARPTGSGTSATPTDAQESNHEHHPGPDHPSDRPWSWSVTGSHAWLPRSSTMQTISSPHRWPFAPSNIAAAHHAPPRSSAAPTPPTTSPSTSSPTPRTCAARSVVHGGWSRGPRAAQRCRSRSSRTLSLRSRRTCHHAFHVEADQQPGPGQP